MSRVFLYHILKDGMDRSESTSETLHRRVLTMAHARGLIFQHVPTPILKLTRRSIPDLQSIMSTETNPTKRNQLQFAIAVKNVLAHRICSPPVNDAYEDVMLRPPHDVQPYRTDSMLVIAYTMNDLGTGVHILGISSFGTCDGRNEENYEFQFVGNGAAEVNRDVANRRVAELDLLCTKQGHRQRGAGGLLLAYCLSFLHAQRATKKVNSPAKYAGVVMTLAEFPMEDAHDAELGRGRQPLRNTALRYGFQPKQVRVKVSHTSASTRTYWLLHGKNWHEKVLQALPKGNADFATIFPSVPTPGRALGQ